MDEIVRRVPCEITLQIDVKENPRLLTFHPVIEIQKEEIAQLLAEPHSRQLRLKRLDRLSAALYLPVGRLTSFFGIFTIFEIDIHLSVLHLALLLVM